MHTAVDGLAARGAPPPPASARSRAWGGGAGDGRGRGAVGGQAGVPGSGGTAFKSFDFLIDVPAPEDANLYLQRASLSRVQSI